MVHEWPTDAPKPAPAPPVRLTRSQRWDMARMATAGFVTVAALGGSAWLITCQGDQASGHGIASAASVASVPIEAPAPSAVTIQVSDVRAPVIVDERPEPVRRAPRPEARQVRPVATTAAVTPVRPSDDPSLSRRVARFITGNGRHEVRPFPTIPDGQR